MHAPKREGVCPRPAERRLERLSTADLYESRLSVHYLVLFIIYVSTGICARRGGHNSIPRSARVFGCTRYVCMYVYENSGRMYEVCMSR
eukprot:COSAG01_NODE_1532_length_10007_cov_4.889842_12_plen_89_part_00